MKKVQRLLSLILAVVMMAGMIPMTGVAASAAETPSSEADAAFELQSTGTMMKAGNTVTVTLTVRGTLAAFSIVPDVDPELFSLTSGKIIAEDAFMKSFSVKDGNGVCSFEEPTEIDGAAATYTLTVTSPLTKAIRISCAVTYEDANEERKSTVVSTVVPFALRGDFDRDEKVNSNDAIYLLRNYLIGDEKYPIYQSGDVNGDGKYTNTDAVHLLRYVLIGGNAYPLNEDPTLFDTGCAHSMTKTEAKAATCTEDGNIEYYFCSVCGKYYSDRLGTAEITLADTVIAAPGHTVVIDPAVPATYESTGLTEGSHCSVCHEVLVQQVEYGPLAPNTKSITYKIVNEAEHPYLATLDIDTSLLEYSYTPGQSKTLVSLDLGKYGYTFDGWYDGFGSNASQIKEIPTSATNDLTVYAHVHEEVYDITYNMYQVPVTSSPSDQQLHYTVSKGNTNLFYPEINNYLFLGWYDDNGVEYKTIPVGTTGNITLNAYYTSLRNLAVGKNDDNPLILEDQNSNVVYFTYEIGEIRNIPLNPDDPFWEIQSVAGLSQQRSETFTTTITESEAKSVSETISDMTVNSSTWTLSENWNDVTTVDETWAESIGKTTEQCQTEAMTSSNTMSISDQFGGSSYHKTEDGSTVYDYDSKTETKDKGHQFNASLNGSYTNKVEANLGASSELGSTDSYGYTKNTKKTSTELSGSESDKDILSAGVSYENGFEVSAGLSYGYHNNTTTVTKTGTDKVTTSSNIDENTSTWNSSAAFSSTNTHSVSNTVRNALSDIVTTTKGYGNSYSQGGSDTSSQGFSSSASNTSGTTSTVTYSKLESKTTTSTYSVDGKIEGKYRSILAGKAHVFAVVGYDFGTKSFFTYTFSVMDDKVDEFLDYTPKGGNFTDCENSCLPFEIPYFVFEYVTGKTVKTSGLTYRTDSVNGTARITGYTGTDVDVIVPSYVSDGTQAYKVTEISSTAFAGKSVRSVVLGEFITSIPDGAFKNSTALEEVIGNFTEIGDEAFAGCTKLTNMNIPSDVVKIGENAFSGVNSISVRAINSLCAYIEAAKEIPILEEEKEDPEVEANRDQLREEKRKEKTQIFIQSVLDSGARNIVLDLSKIVEGVELSLTVPEIDSLEIKGGTKLYRNFSLDSNAKETILGEMTISNQKLIPLTLSSDRLTLHKVFITANNTAILLKKDGAVLSLVQDNVCQTTSAYAIIAKNPVVESTVTKDGAVGFLTVSGNFGYVNSITGEENVDITDGNLILISEEEFEKYLLGTVTVTFDANGGNVELQTMELYIGSDNEEFPIPERDYYTFDGWYTAADGGTQVTAATVLTSPGNITVYAHWTVNAYTVSWSNGTGYTITVNRTASPNKGAPTGSLSSGSPVYYGDVLSVTYSAATGYSVSSKGAETITVTGNADSSIIYASATPNYYTYYVVYKSSNGTSLDASSVTYRYGTTNTVSPYAIPGYSTPSAQTVKWDSTSSKTIEFIYYPTPVGTTAVSGAIGDQFLYSGTLEYQNRTASSVEVRVNYTLTIKANNWNSYGQRLNVSTNAGSSYTQLSSYGNSWKNTSSSARSINGSTGWMKVNLGTTNATTAAISYYHYQFNSNGTDMTKGYGTSYMEGSWTMNIPAY